MRIVIDLQGAQSESRFRGIGRYSLSIAQAIIRNRGDHEIIIALSGLFPETIDPIRAAFDELLPQKNIRVWLAPMPIRECEPGNTWRREVAELIREAFLSSLQPDIILLTSLFEGYVDDAVTSIGRFDKITTTAVILYDLISYINPKAYLPTGSQRDYYYRKIDSLKRADLFLSISEYSKQETVDAVGLPEKNITTISSAVDDRFSPTELSANEINSLKQRYTIERKMVMYAPGGFDVRKNFDSLIKAYASLPKTLRAEHQLVIVSKIQEDNRIGLLNLAKQAGLAKDELVLTGYVPEDDLVALYSSATLFVFPSKHEGFGLPVLEAMKCGAPVIGSNTTSIPEVIGNNLALFDPDSVDSIAAKMQQALQNESFREELCNKSVEQAKHFSWDESAKRAISSFEDMFIYSDKDLNDSKNATYRINDELLINSIANINTLTKHTEDDIYSVAKAIAFNTSINTPKQMLVDISELAQRDAKSGIQRVVRSILLEFLSTPPDEYEVKPIYFDGKQYRYASGFTAQFLGESKPETVDMVAEFNQDDIYLALDLNAHLTQAVHQLHISLQSMGVQMFYIVYDILLIQRPDWWPEGTSKVVEEWLISISQAATGLICISESVAEEVREWLNTHPPSRHTGLVVSSFYLGADVNNSVPSKGLPATAKTELNQISKSSSFLMVGTLEPRKGHTQVLQAFEQLWQKNQNVSLIIVGKQGWMVEALIKKLQTSPELNKRLFWLDGISDEYLEKVYAASTCLIAASYGEGFGLPLIEAAQHKLPIIARDIPVFHEVAGEHAYYFTDKEPDAIATAISTWLGLYHNDQHPKSDAMPWLTWKESASRLGNILVKKN